jgi:hypothetical protein
LGRIGECQGGGWARFLVSPFRSAPLDSMRRLADLSDRELAPLFNMTVPEVRRYRRPSKGVLEDAMSNDMRAENDRYAKWL